MYATCASPSLTDSRARARFLCILCVFCVGHVVDDSDADDEDRDNVEGSCSYPFLLLLLFLPVFTRQLLKEDDFCCAHSRCLWSIVHSSRDLWHIVKRILGEALATCEELNVLGCFGACLSLQHQLCSLAETVSLKLQRLFTSADCGKNMYLFQIQIYPSAMNAGQRFFFQSLENENCQKFSSGTILHNCT